MVTTWYIFYLLIISGGFIFGLLFLRQNKGFYPIIILLGSTLLSEILARILAYTFRNSSPAYHFLDLVEIICWAIFFYKSVKGSKSKIVIMVSAFALVAFSIVNSLFIQSVFYFPDNYLKVAPVIFVLWSSFLFIETLDTPSEINIFRLPVFVISLAVIWYNLTSFVFYQFHEIFITTQIPAGSLRFINYFSNYTYYLMLLIAITLQIKISERKIL